MAICPPSAYLSTLECSLELYTLHFPSLSSLTPQLVALGLKPKAAESINEAYAKGALTLKGKFQSEYLKACCALDSASDARGLSSSNLKAKLRSILVSKYQAALSVLENKAMEKTKTHKSIQNSKRPPTTDVPRGFQMPPRKPSASSVELLTRDAHRPPYAFPTVYPPVEEPSAVLPTPPPTANKRLPSRRHAGVAVESADVDALTKAFTKLTIHDVPSRSTRRRPQAKKLPSRPPTATRLPLNSSLSISSKISPRVSRPAAPVLTALPQYPNYALFVSSLPKTSNIPSPTEEVSLPPSYSTFPTVTSPSIKIPHTPSKSRTPSLISDSGSEPGSPDSWIDPPDLPHTPTDDISSADKTLASFLSQNKSCPGVFNIPDSYFIPTALTSDVGVLSAMFLSTSTQL